MKPDEQARVQRRMQAWAKLTPKERQAARERYKKMEKLPPDKKLGLKQQWEEYNRLPEQERRKLGSTPRKPAAPARPANSPAEPSSPPAALRYALAWPSLLVFGVGFLWAFVDRDRQFLHDRLAGTRIVMSDDARARAKDP